MTEQTVELFGFALVGHHESDYGAEVLAALEYWHTVHRLPFALGQASRKNLEKAWRNGSTTPATPAQPVTGTTAPATQARPVTQDDLIAMRNSMHMNDRCHAAIYACALFVFFSCSKFGEFTVSAVSHPEVYRPMVKHAAIRPAGDGLESLVVTLHREHSTDSRTERIATTQRSCHACLDPITAWRFHRSQN